MCTNRCWLCFSRVAGLSVRNVLAWRVLSDAYMQAASDLLPAAVLTCCCCFFSRTPVRCSSSDLLPPRPLSSFPFRHSLLQYSTTEYSIFLSIHITIPKEFFSKCLQTLSIDYLNHLDLIINYSTEY